LRFSDVAREADLTQATAHAILKTLCDRGWASRDPVTKTFSLGPALAVVAARTDMARPLAHAARAAALEVSGEVGYAGSVVERFGESLVITAFEGDDSREPAGIPGDRIPYVPPFGVAFAAWDPEAEQRAWIERSAAGNTVLAERLEQVLTRTRERGFDVDWTTPALGQTAYLVRTLQNDGLPPNVREVIDQLLVECIAVGFLAEDDPARKAQPVATIAAPVFYHSDRVALIVCVHPLRALTLRQINSIGRRLTRATTAISV
jgi:DNA-binding IclR family transcriptional regulator